MGVTKKKSSTGGSKRWTGDQPRTYKNYGRNVPSTVKLTQDLIKLHIKVNRFAEKRASTEDEHHFAAMVSDALEALLRLIATDALERTT